MSGDEGRSIRCDEQDGACNLVRTADPLLRIERRQIGFAVRPSGEAFEHASVDGAGRDRVHTHTKRAGFERYRFGQSLDRMLACRIIEAPTPPSWPKVDEMLTMLRCVEPASRATCASCCAESLQQAPRMRGEGARISAG